MAEAVVDDLEPIEVEIEDREPSTGTGAALLHVCEPAADPLDEHRAGVQSREPIDELHAAQALLRDGRVRRIGQRPGKTGRTVTARSRGDAAAQEPAIAAVLVTHAAFVMEVLGLAGKMRLDRFLEGTKILSMNTAGPFFRPRDSRCR